MQYLGNRYFSIYADSTKYKCSNYLTTRCKAELTILLDGTVETKNLPHTCSLPDYTLPEKKAALDEMIHQALTTLDSYNDIFERVIEGYQFLLVNFFLIIIAFIKG